jgi:hypothetical protein
LKRACLSSLEYTTIGFLRQTKHRLDFPQNILRELQKGIKAAYNIVGMARKEKSLYES